MTANGADLDVLLEYLNHSRGVDFNAYKRPSLQRRIGKRMQEVGIQQYCDYVDYLEVHPEEFGLLFNTVLINVTAFFRDEASWTCLRDEIVPQLLDAQPGGPLRIWSAGCSSGEEAYSLAMVLAGAMGRPQFRNRVKIYATDVDEQALNQARAASYDDKQMAGVPQPLVESYFIRDGDRFVFDRELRRSVIFGRHDLIQDAPISRVQLLLCRNTIMYFNAEAQGRILTRFHFALGDRGVLFLGKAEMLLTRAQLFTPIDMRSRIFRKVANDRRAAFTVASRPSAEEGRADDLARLLPAVFEAIPNAQFVIDADGRLAMCNERGRALFNLSAGDIGRPIQDLELSFRPVELRSLIAQVSEQRLAAVVRDVRWDSTAREPRHFDIHLGPLADGGRVLGVAVTFVDVSPQQDLQNQLSRVRQDLETAYEELQSTNEELETTNEELQSTVEELETTNEELQSTNEELETVNTELRSTNDGLQVINLEQRQHGLAADRLNGFMQAILAGVRSAVIVIDRESRVLAWNRAAEDLWGMRADEVRARDFFRLDFGLPTEQVRAEVRACLLGDREVIDTLTRATNRRGRPIACRVVATPLLSDTREVCGAILVMEEQSELQ